MSCRVVRDLLRKLCRVYTDTETLPYDNNNNNNDEAPFDSHTYLLKQRMRLGALLFVKALQRQVLYSVPPLVGCSLLARWL